MPGKPGVDYSHYNTMRIYPYKPHHTKETLPANEGLLTNKLSNQKRFIKSLISASLQSGLVPSDAVTRATEAATWVRSQAVAESFDSEDQETIKAFIVASMRSQGVTSGVTLAQRGIEAMRLMNDWLKVVRKDERAKAKRGVTL